MNTNVSENKSHLQGRYERKNKTLVNSEIGNDATLVICYRKNPTPSKPLNYILLKEGKKSSYISSMYNTGKEGVYQLEFNGIQYLMTSNDTGYTITAKHN